MLGPRKNIVFVEHNPRFNSRPGLPFFNYSLGGIARPNIIYMKEHGTKKNIRQIEKIMSQTSKPFTSATVRSDEKITKKIPKDSPKILSILKGGAKKSHVSSKEKAKLSGAKSRYKIAKNPNYSSHPQKRSYNNALENSLTGKQKKSKCQKTQKPIATEQERAEKPEERNNKSIEKVDTKEAPDINEKGKKKSKKPALQETIEETKEDTEDETEDGNTDSDPDDSEEEEDKDEESESNEDEEDDEDEEDEEESESDLDDEKEDEEENEGSTESEEELFESEHFKTYNKVGYGKRKKQLKKRKNNQIRMREKEEQALANALMHPLKVFSYLLIHK